MHQELLDRFGAATHPTELDIAGLPASYLETVRRVALLDEPVGEFRLSPAVPAELDALGLIEVASAGGDALCVERGGDGRVLWVRDEPVPRDIAPSFADAVLVLARYDDARWGDGPVELDAVTDGVDLTDEQRGNLARLLAL